eukprot:GFYU01056982.1.p1 GENE.GFYU01056982.1~~GFYU01056982.1.p1  ORF type:complete len:104 (-),score=4.36 GFYU01056982.1:22-333(-)
MIEALGRRILEAYDERIGQSGADRKTESAEWRAFERMIAYAQGKGRGKPEYSAEYSLRAVHYLVNVLMDWSARDWFIHNNGSHDHAFRSLCKGHLFPEAQRGY